MFQVPDTKGAEAANRFEFSVGEETFSVPLLKFAPVEAQILFDRGYNAEGLIACADTPEAAAAIRKLAADQLDALETAWVAASKVSPGESEPSTDS